MKKSLMTLIALSSFGIVGCQTVTPPPAPTPRAPSDVYVTVVINGVWQLGGHRLDHETTVQGAKILRAKAENGARVASLVPPVNSRVMVEGHADEITYNAFTSEFLLHGHPQLIQGDTVISGSNEHSQILLKEDGEIRVVGAIKTTVRQVPENWEASQ